jgi:hypothetical protein
MSPQPNQPPNSEPVRVEVPAERVDPTLDLRAVLNGIAANADRVAKRRGAAAPARDVSQKLKTAAKLANELADLLDEVETTAPTARAAMERRS